MTTLGIIQADEIDAELRPQLGNTIAIFQRLFSRAEAPDLCLRRYDARYSLYPDDVDECDGYLISGSRYCAFDDLAWIQGLLEFVRTLDEVRKPLIGICFGHQCIALALGGTVVRAEQGWGLGVQEYEVLQPAVLSAVTNEWIKLRCSHEDQVARLPDRATRILTNDFCENAGMIVGDHIISLQAHPEFELAFAEHLIRNRKNELGERFAAILASLELEVDDVAVAQSLLHFLNR